MAEVRSPTRRLGRQLFRLRNSKSDWWCRSSFLRLQWSDGGLLRNRRYGRWLETLIVEPVLLRWLAKAGRLRLLIASLLRWLVACRLGLLEVRGLYWLLSKTRWLRLQSWRQYGVDTTRWRTLPRIASISCLLRRKRWLIRGSGIGERAPLSIAIYERLLLRLKVHELWLLLLLLLESSLLRLKSVYELSLSRLREASRLRLQLWLAILLLESLLIELI